MGKKLDLHFDGEYGLRLLSPENGFATVGREDGDFWRAFLDTGEIRELSVYSHDQTPVSVTELADGKVYVYDRLTAENGEVFAVTLEITVRRTNGTVEFSSVIENHSDAILNELQLPFLEAFDYGCDPDAEVLYTPDGIGARTPNPRRTISWFHTEYMSADYKSTWMTHTYPPTNGRMLSMPWIGLQCGDKFLYFGEHFTARQLYELGMVSRVYADEVLEASALLVAKRLATTSPLVVKGYKERMKDVIYGDNLPEWRRREMDMGRQLAATEDSKNAIACGLRGEVYDFKGY